VIAGLFFGDFEAENEVYFNGKTIILIATERNGEEATRATRKCEDKCNKKEGSKKVLSRDARSQRIGFYATLDGPVQFC